MNNFFAELPEAEKLLAEASEALELVAPFGYDESVRMALQLIVVSSIFTILFVAYAVNPFWEQL